MNRITSSLCAIGLGVASVAAVATPASAAPSPGDPTVVVSGLIGPLGLTVDRSGTAIVAQNFGGVLSAVDKKGGVTDLVVAPGEEISAPAVDGKSIYYMRGNELHTEAVVYELRNGVSTEIGDLAAFEAAENPDSVNTYGFLDMGAECADQFVPFPPYPPLGTATYTGFVDTHAYGATAKDGTVYIADAGANAILAVADGDVETVAVLPPSDPVPVSAGTVAESGWPECAIGQEYSFEPVPTDVEFGPDGMLYVTTLPGGPEDPSLGARGAVYQVDPGTGDVELVADGFLSATGIAVSPNGTIFVAELFAGQVSMLAPGATEPTPLVEVPLPGAIDIRGETLYITTDSLGDGSVSTVPLKGVAHARN
ncbi:MAG TPA: ScyD/ScyE family protein [Agromyces sp.]